jgi:translation initiation factor eIF-2B subunit epsilon
VGQGVKITNSFLGNNVIVEDNSEIHEAVIADNTILTKGTELKPWVLVQGTVQTRIELPAAGDEEESDSDSDVEVAGPGAEGSDYEIEDEGREGGIQDDDFIKFSGEVLDSLQRGFEENVATENLVLEINSSKYAYNISFKELTAALTKGVLALVAKLNPGLADLGAKTQWVKTKEAILKFKGLFGHYIKTEEAQSQLLNALEEYANDHVYFQPLLMQTLHCLYDEDILTEEAILEWHSSESLYAAGKQLRALVQQFVSWLENAESEEDSA